MVRVTCTRARSVDGEGGGRRTPVLQPWGAEVQPLLPGATRRRGQGRDPSMAGGANEGGDGEGCEHRWGVLQRQRRGCKHRQ